MKRLLSISLFFLLSSYNLFAQNDSVQIATIYEQILKGIEQKDYSISFDHTYPKLYDIIPRESMEAAMNQVLNQEDLEIGFLDSKILSIRPIDELDGIKYQKVSYRSKMFMKMDMESDTSAFDSSLLVLMSLKKSFGAKNVSQDALSNAFIIDTVKTGLAIWNPTYGSWKILTIEPHMGPILDKIIPKTILDSVIE